MILAGLLVQGRQESVPLKEISVRAFLQGSLVGFRSKLAYENSSKDPLEVLFRTPLDDSYAVVDLEAVIDGKKIRAELQEKEKAKEMYKEAIASGRTAAFGEEIKGDIFSVALGNLPAGKKAEIHLTIVGELDTEPDGSVRFVLPTVLKPRYTPAGNTDPLEPAAPQNEKPVKHTEGPLLYKFDLVINHASEVAEVTSPSHEIRQETSGQVINVGIFEDIPKDIVILVRPKEPHKPLVIIEPGLSDGSNDFQKSTAVMLSFFPEFKGDSSCAQAACEFVFVIDRSGSMSGQHICDAAQTLLLFLKSIPEGCYFNVVGFGSSYEKLFPESVPYNQATMEKAVQHTEELQADLGGTEIFDPLKDIFSLKQMKGLPRQVFVLTDGSVSNTESVIKLVAKNSHNARCFSFGIGSGASTSLVKGIATAGKGTAEFITTGERMQPKVIRSLKKAMQPAVTETKVEFSLPGDFTIQVTPENVPPIFIGERTIVFGILTQNSTKEVPKLTQGSVCLSGNLLGAKIKHELKLEIPTAVAKDEQQVTTIHHLAGKRLIKEMESSADKDDQREAIIKLSLDSRVISSFTGFIAIDKDTKEPVKGSMQTWDVISPMELGMETYGGGFTMHSRAVMSFDGCDFYDVDSSDSYQGMVTYGGGYTRSLGRCDLYDDVDSSDSYEGEFEEDMGMPGKGYAFMPGPAASPPHSCRAPQEKGMMKAKSGKGVPPKIQQMFKSSKAECSKPHCVTLSASIDSSPQRTSPHGVGNAKPNQETIISLQLASGAWSLSSELATCIGKTKDAIKASCPVPCEGNIETIWATIIALAYLKHKQSDLKDEWELVAAKAQSWLAKQSLPKGCAIELLHQKAVEVVS